MLTMSPTASSGADSPTFSPSYSPTGNSELIVSHAVVANDPPSSTSRNPSTKQPSASATPTYLPTIISDDELRSSPTYYPTSGKDELSAPSSSVLEETNDKNASATSNTPEISNSEEDDSNSKIVQVEDASESTSSTDQAFSKRNNSTSTPSLAPHTERPTSIMLDETQSRPDISSAFINNVSKSSNSSMTEVKSTNESTSEAGEATSDVAASPSPGANVTIPAKRPASNEPSQVEVDTDAPLVDESPFVPRPPHQDIAETTAIQVKLPRIICDITISQSLLGVLEQKRALLSTMKTTVNQILRTNLPSLYKYLGVLFDVQVVESASDLESPSLRRLHAFFNGTASFSPQGAHPTEQEIIKLLLAHFDVDAFSQSLRAPLRDRRLTASALAPHGSSDTVVKVNSVFLVHSCLPDPCLTRYRQLPHL